MGPLFHSVAHLLALRMVQSLVEGLFIALFAAGILGVSRHSAGTRFAVWFSSLIAIAILPIVSGEGLWQSAAVTHHAAVTLPESCAFFLLAVWLILASWFLLRIAKGLCRLRTIRGRCVEIDPQLLEPRLQQILGCHSTRRVTLCTSPDVRVPTAIGLLKPAVIVPEWVMRDLPADDLNQIVLHELAHLNRYDDWTNFAQQIVKALFFFHPVVWWIEKNVSLEREMACDDAVLAETANPRAYAKCLVNLAERSLVQKGLALAQAALGRVRQTTQRVVRILDPNRPAHSRVLMPVVSIVAVFALGCGVWVGRTSGWIAFQQSPAEHAVLVKAPESPAVTGREFDPAALRAVRSQPQPAVVPAKLDLDANGSRKSIRRTLLKSGVDVAKPAKCVLQRTGASTAEIPVTDALFVVIENRGFESAAVPAVHVEMWRIVVLRTVTQASSTPSRKT